MADPTFIDIQERVAALLQTTIAALTITGQNLVAQAINNAKRTAERSYDFYYCQLNSYLAIGANGGDISNAYSTASLTVTGTLSPDVTGTWTIAGTFNGQPLYSLFISPNTYLLFNVPGTAWIMSREGINPSDYWILATASASPVGTYIAHGTYTGSPVIASAPTPVELKRVDNVLAPISGGYVPLEFLTFETWMERIRQQIGRQAYNGGLTLAQYGFYMPNPVAVQQGTNISLQLPSQFIFPVTVQLDASQFMPDYVADGDTDFFMKYGPEFLVWQGVMECNKLQKFFVPRREGNLDEPNVEAFAQQAFLSLVEWDQSISRTTGSPDSLRFVPPVTRQLAPSK